MSIERVNVEYEESRTFQVVHHLVPKDLNTAMLKKDYIFEQKILKMKDEKFQRLEEAHRIADAQKNDIVTKVYAIEGELVNNNV